MVSFVILVLGGLVTVKSFFDSQREQEQSWAAKQAVTQDRLDDLSGDMQWTKDKLWELNQQCKH